MSLAFAVALPQLCLFRLPGALSMVGAILARISGQPYAVEVVGDPRDVLASGVLGTSWKMGSAGLRVSDALDRPWRRCRSATSRRKFCRVATPCASTLPHTHTRM